MYGQESSSILAATGSGLIIVGSYFSYLQVVSIGVGVVLLVTALVIAVRRSRRGRQ